MLLGAVAVQLGDDVAQPLELRAEALDPLLERRGAQVELAGAARHRVAELLAGQLGGHVGRGRDRVLALHPEAGLQVGGLLREGGGLLLEGDGHPLVGGGRAGAGRAGPDQVGEDQDDGHPEGGEDSGDDHGESVRRGCDSPGGPCANSLVRGHVACRT